jgi:hypothetical protein
VEHVDQEQRRSKLVDFILDSIGFIDGIIPASLASTITPIVPIIVKPS